MLIPLAWWLVLEGTDTEKGKLKPKRMMGERKSLSPHLLLDYEGVNLNEGGQRLRNPHLVQRRRLPCAAKIPKHWHFTLGLTVNQEVHCGGIGTKLFVSNEKLSMGQQHTKREDQSRYDLLLEQLTHHIPQHSRTLTSTTPY